MDQPQPKTRHVIFIGETCSGKSSIINLIADRDYAAVSPDGMACTLHFASYDVSIRGRTYRLWDTPGLNKPSGFRLFGRSPSTSDSIRRFLQERRRCMELDLLVLCVRGTRANEGMLKAYKIFCHATRQIAIPVVIAITHLERAQPTMDTWWHDNERALRQLGWASQQDIHALISNFEYPQRDLSTLSDQDSYLSDDPGRLFNRRKTTVIPEKANQESCNQPSGRAGQARQEENSNIEAIKPSHGHNESLSNGTMQVDPAIEELSDFASLEIGLDDDTTLDSELGSLSDEGHRKPDPEIRNADPRGQYIDATAEIRRVIDETIADLPHVLIDVTTGRLNDRSLQAAAFQAIPTYEDLRSSIMTSGQLDVPCIRKEVEKFYEYVMFSHKWQPGEPTFQMLKNSSIDKLPNSSANNKLRGFRNIVRSRHFRWFWSDTCCVNQADNMVLQESIVAMFRWYHRSSLTVVHLLGVFSASQQVGHLRRSIWNERGWTYQEYVASPVVQFYTEDWKPYLGLDVINHKDSPRIRREMEQATEFATSELTTLQPGMDRAREKLYLASRRKTTREEDIAYCLFGIFRVSIPVVYGEGKEAAVRRLLEDILTRSANVTLLSWTGQPGSSNSYLPLDLTVYNKIAPPHIPRLTNTDNMASKAMALRRSPSVSLVIQLYNQLYNLPPLSLAAGRLRLSGLVFPLTPFSGISEPDSDPTLRVYRTTTPLLGRVRIQTKDDLSGMTSNLLLIHPWISPLLDEDFSGATPQFDLDTRALRLVVRLRQPFGALLLAPKDRIFYRRVASDSFIEVQIRKETSLKEWISCVRTVDVQ